MYVLHHLLCCSFCISLSSLPSPHPLHTTPHLSTLLHTYPPHTTPHLSTPLSSVPLPFHTNSFVSFHSITDLVDTTTRKCATALHRLTALFSLHYPCKCVLALFFSSTSIFSARVLLHIFLFFLFFSFPFSSQHNHIF